MIRPVYEIDEQHCQQHQDTLHGVDDTCSQPCSLFGDPHLFFFDGVGTGLVVHGKNMELAAVAGASSRISRAPVAVVPLASAGGLRPNPGGSAMGFDGIGSVLISGGGVVGGFGCSMHAVAGIAAQQSAV